MVTTLTRYSSDEVTASTKRPQQGQSNKLKVVLPISTFILYTNSQWEAVYIHMYHIQNS